MQKLLYLVGFVLLAFALWNVLYFKPTYDGALFLSVGRAILNGRTPYIDLFETKPPGIFYLSALAWLAGGEWAARVFSGLALLGIFWACFRNRYGFTIGVILTVLGSLYGGRYFPEIFGAAFLCVAVRKFPSVAWMSAGMALALFFKETLLLPTLAVGCLLVRNVSDGKRYAVSVLGGLGLFTLGLLGTGLLHEYLTIYLPFMVSIRVGGASNTGILLWLRDLWVFSPAFVVLVCSCLWRQQRFPEFLLDGVALLLLIATCLMGNYSGSHATAAIPIYMALFLREESKRNFLLAAATLLLIPLSGRIWGIALSPLHHQENSGDRRWDHAYAEQLDAIMDACGYERYFYLGGSDPILGLTRHSPEGPLLYLEYYMLQNPYLVQATLERAPGSQIIVFEKKTNVLAIEKEMYDLTQPFVEENFTLRQPPCADGLAFDATKYVLFYRK